MEPEIWTFRIRSVTCCRAGFEHAAEHLGSFPLVFDLRIAFRVAAQADGALEMVHGQQMFFPDAVVNIQEDVFFQPGQFAAEEGPAL